MDTLQQKSHMTSFLPYWQHHSVVWLHSWWWPNSCSTYLPVTNPSADSVPSLQPDTSPTTDRHKHILTCSVFKSAHVVTWFQKHQISDIRNSFPPSQPTTWLALMSPHPTSKALQGTGNKVLFLMCERLVIAGLQTQNQLQYIYIYIYINLMYNKSYSIKMGT
jgi:hypothetical protein